MADNFDLRKFLSENKLTKNAQLLKEELDTRSTNDESIDLWIPGASDSEDPEGDAQFIQDSLAKRGIQSKVTYSIDEWYVELDNKDQIERAGDVLHDIGYDYNKTEMWEGVNEGSYMDAYETQAAKDAYYIAREVVVNNLESTTYEDLPQIVADAVNQAEQETGEQVSELEKRALLKHINWVLTHNQQMEFESKQTKKPVMESKLSPRETYLTRLVENALGLPAESYHDSDDLENTTSNDDAYGKAFDTMDESEMVNEKPMPKYENIEKLMQEIDKSTDEAAHKHKMEEMKRVADMLEKKCTALEEGEDADHIDQKKLKQMKKDIMTLRKGIEKMEKLAEKKFAKKETKAELKEGFDLKKFLTENKVTYNSRLLTEGEKWLDGSWNSDNYKDLIKKIENTFATGGRGNSFTYNGTDFTITKKGERYHITSGSEFTFEALSVESAIKEAHAFSSK